ncbi:D-alanine--D-alanine ligase [Sulfuricaulis sp.]|jgi:D-alanine-D-alanine ligase|uniref:D-alanine--D-alanine ligase family protein n=1 Tax=Sulfuricaulis sp. TaxID=2003553 RepID=UPI003559477D
MKKLRVMMVVHYTLVPPDDLLAEGDPRMEKYRTEYDVKTALLTLGHEVQVVGVYGDLAPIRKVIEEWKPHIAFNLLEDFAGNSAFDYYVVSYFDMMHLPHTGCNPRGLLLARDKALSKMILTYHRISVPHFTVFPRGKKISRLRKFTYPLIVKSLMEEGSVGIAKASYVENDAQLRERVALIHEKLQGDAIAEEYIDGRELYVTILGNTKLEVLPLRELEFGGTEPGTPRMATYKVKWDDKYRERWKIEYQFARNLPNGMAERIGHLCKRVYHLLDMSGYGRLDLRATADGELYVLEANPNPGIARDEDCSLSAIKTGLSYEDFIQRILQLGLMARSIDE